MKKLFYKTWFSCVIILLLCLSFNEIYAQTRQKTAYEKKLVEITQKYFKVLYGNNRQLSMYNQAQLDQITDDKTVRNLILGYGILGYATNHSAADVKKMVTQIENELKQAEKLKTAVDFQREFEQTEAGVIKKNIKTAFEKWNQKGEFEKEADYGERLKTQSQAAFEKICIEQIKTKIEGMSSNKNRIELSTYNSERELFVVLFKTNGVEWQSEINIPISNAEDFKNNWSNLKSTVDNYDWCFVKNSLCPTLVTLYGNDQKYNFPMSLTNQSDISYSFDSFEIANSYLNGYVFKFSNAKAMAEQQAKEQAEERQRLAEEQQRLVKEQQRLDSLEVVTYNQKLDSVFKDYNRQLLQNPHNVAKKVMTGYDKIDSTGNRKDNFNRSQNAIKSKFEALNFIVEKDLEEEYIKSGKLFTSKNEFEAFYTKGNDAYLPEVEKRTVLNYFTVNSNFVQSLDFQKGKDDNQTRKNILSMINKSKDKPYYPQIMDFVVETNKNLNKEWIKNGESFGSKIEFYEAYISENYKQILKENKKKK
jgi:hypothetical protein